LKLEIQLKYFCNKNSWSLIWWSILE